MAGTAGQPRFLTLADVAEILNTSQAQVYALVKRRELRAIQIGGRGQWRVEASKLEEFIEHMYDKADAAADAPAPADEPDRR
jgi:excisionase family DNA binding protein